MTISTPSDMEIRKTKLSSQNKLHTNVGCVHPSAYTHTHTHTHCLDHNLQNTVRMNKRKE